MKQLHLYSKGRGAQPLNVKWAAVTYPTPTTSARPWQGTMQFPMAQAWSHLTDQVNIEPSLRVRAAASDAPHAILLSSDDCRPLQSCSRCWFFPRLSHFTGTCYSCTSAGYLTLSICAIRSSPTWAGSSFLTALVTSAAVALSGSCRGSQCGGTCDDTSHLVCTWSASWTLAALMSLPATLMVSSG